MLLLLLLLISVVPVPAPAIRQRLERDALNLLFLVVSDEGSWEGPWALGLDLDLPSLLAATSSPGNGVLVTASPQANSIPMCRQTPFLKLRGIPNRDTDSPPTGQTTLSFCSPLSNLGRLQYCVVGNSDCWLRCPRMIQGLLNGGAAGPWSAGRTMFSTCSW